MRRKPLSILFAALAVVAVAARFFLYFTAIDPATGFYNDSSRVLGLVVSTAFVVGLIVCVVLFRFLSEPSAGVIGRAPGLAVISFGMAGALCCDTLVSLVRSLSALQCLVGLFALLSAAYFVCTGIDRLRGTRHTPGLLYATVPVWAAVKLVIYYTQFHGVIYISEGILEVFALALSMMFWLYHTRMVTGMEPGRAAQWGYGFGIAAAVACCMVTLPRLVAGVMGRDDLTAHGLGLEVALLISAVYIVVFLVRYHIACVDSPFSSDPVLETEEAAKESSPLTETEPVADSSEEETAAAQADDRIDRLVDELLRQKQEENGEDA